MSSKPTSTPVTASAPSGTTFMGNIRPRRNAFSCQQPMIAQEGSGHGQGTSRAIIRQQYQLASHRQRQENEAAVSDTEA